MSRTIAPELSSSMPVLCSLQPATIIAPWKPQEHDHYQVTQADNVTLMQTGKMVEENKIHDATISDLQMYVDGTHFVTASNDRSAKLVDSLSLEVLKVYQTERNANSAALSPTEDHVSSWRVIEQLSVACVAGALQT